MWPDMEKEELQQKWEAYCRMPRPHPISTDTQAARVHALITQAGVKSRLVEGGGRDCFADILILGCFGHRLMAALQGLDWGSIPPGSVRVLAFNGPIPTDACAVALYNYRLATTYNSPTAFLEVIIPAWQRGSNPCPLVPQSRLPLSPQGAINSVL